MHTPASRTIRCITLVLAFGCLLASASAQIRTDTSLGHPAQTLIGPNFVIPQTLGLVSGANLFESFSAFNVPNGGSATFTTVTPFSNVIARVTGGASTINGNLNLLATLGAPNLFFINPAGITFGNGMEVNVPAGFHATTANYIKFADGRFYSDTSHTSTFSALAPEAFGFLGTARAALTVTNGAFLDTGFAPASVVAGDITVTNGSAVATFGGGDLVVAAVGRDVVEIPLTGPLPAAHGNLVVSNGGSIFTESLASASGALRASAGTVTVDGQTSNFFTGIYTDDPVGSLGNSGPLTLLATGNVSLVNYGSITTSTESSGNAGALVMHVAGNVNMASGGTIYSRTTGSGNANDVTLTAGALTIDGGGADPPAGISVFASAGTGNAGNLSVSVTGDVTMTNHAFMGGNTYTNGTGGLVQVDVGGQLLMTNASGIGSDTKGSGAAGDVDVMAASIIMTGNATSTTGISTASLTSTSGPAGDISITTPGSLIITGGGGVNSSTDSLASAGTIHVSAGSIYLNGANEVNGPTSGISTNAGQFAHGDAGTIYIDTPGLLSITNGGAIGSAAFETFGHAGQIFINAGSLYMSGGASQIGAQIDTSAYTALRGPSNGQIEINVSGDLVMAPRSFIQSDTYGLADAGSVQVTAGNLTINGGNTLETGITSQSFGFGFPGSAGSIHVDVLDTLSLLQGGVISSSTSSYGHAGSVVVDARNIVVDGKNSSIDASAFFESGGQTGSVVVNASNTLTIADHGAISILDSAQVADPAALTPTTLTVNAQNIALRSGAAINASSLFNVDAGTIDINFGELLTLDPSGILTVANTGNGGTINIKGGIAVVLESSAITTSVYGSKGNGGNINISADLLVLDSGFVQANTKATNAIGGQVNIDVGSVIVSQVSLFVGGDVFYLFEPDVPGFNVIQAAAPTGISGQIDISSPVLNLAASLSSLGAHLLDTGGLGRSRCQSSGGSSLALAGRGGFAPSSRELLHASADEAPPSGSAQSFNAPPIRATDHDRYDDLALASFGCAH
jgi:filamentous hemagglutinin family protein